MQQKMTANTTTKGYLLTLISRLRNACVSVAAMDRGRYIEKYREILNEIIFSFQTT